MLWSGVVCNCLTSGTIFDTSHELAYLPPSLSPTFKRSSSITSLCILSHTFPPSIPFTFTSTPILLYPSSHSLYMPHYLPQIALLLFHSVFCHIQSLPLCIHASILSHSFSPSSQTQQLSWRTHGSPPIAEAQPPPYWP